MGLFALPLQAETRQDSAVRLDINLSGSLQNPAFSPDGSEIVFTRFRRGYNRGDSDLYVYTLNTGALRRLVFDAGLNINLPGSVWNRINGMVVFSSERDDHHDEIFIIPANGRAGDETRVTNRPDRQAYEPSFSPDGNWVVFESHELDIEAAVITKFRIDGSSGYIDLTPESGGYKQPNWSPTGRSILYQREENGVWAIWVMNADGSGHRQISGPDESATDAVFSSDGRWIIYSSENENTALANIYRIPAGGGNRQRITNFNGYDGAPSVSPDGRFVAFESSKRDPDRSRGTEIWITRAIATLP